MKKIFKRISIVLAVCLSIICFAGCKKDDVSNTLNPVFENTELYYNDCYLVNKGQSDYIVLIADEAEKYEIYAANELVKYLKEATGVKLRIVNESAAPITEKFISVGHTEKAKQAGVVADVNKLGYSGFVLKSNPNGNVYINAGCQEAVCYGVYEFLTRHVGFEAYSIDELFVDKKFSVPLMKLEETVLPVIDYRVFSYAHFINYPDANLAMRLHHGYGGGSSISEGNLLSLFAHSMSALGISASTYPQYYVSTQYCMTKDGSDKLVAEKLMELIRQDVRDKITYQLGQEDIQGSCSCTTCTESDMENGGAGGTYIIFLNRVSDLLKDMMQEEGIEKDITLCALAYLGYERAPTIYNAETKKYEPVNESVVCRDNVTVMYCPINSCHFHPFDEPTCEINSELTDTYDNFMGWSVLTHNDFMVWSYNVKAVEYFLVYNDFCGYVDNMKFYEKIGVNFTFYQGINSNARASFDAFRAYMVSKLSWDTSLTFNQLFNDFFDHYYKEAAPVLKKYYNAVQAHYATLYDKFQTGGCGGINQLKHNYAEYGDWDYLVLKNFKEILAEAYTLIENSNRTTEEKQILKQRIMIEDVSIDAVIKEAYPLFIADYDAFMVDFTENCKTLGFVARFEGGAGV